jgi:hypothetical protein
VREADKRFVEVEDDGGGASHGLSRKLSS